MLPGGMLPFTFKIAIASHENPSLDAGLGKMKSIASAPMPTVGNRMEYVVSPFS